jgi:osmotically-inducible protein OsmY
MKSAIHYGLLLALTMPCAIAAGAEPPSAPSGEVKQSPNPDFVKLDKNKDGFLSRSEAAKDKATRAAFAKYDEDKDGKLTEDEFIKLKSNKSREKAGEYIGDSAVTTKVKATLLKAKGIKSTEISVATADGVVTLSGTVDTAAQVKRAGSIAAKVKGVKKVENKLAAK